VIHDLRMRRVAATLLLLLPFTLGFIAACYSPYVISREDLRGGNYPKKEQLKLSFPSGTVILLDGWTLDYPIVEGEIDEISGSVPQTSVEGSPKRKRFNLEDAQKIEIYKFSKAKLGGTVAGSVLGLTALLVAIIVALLSCPAVYLLTPTGDHLIGAAYPAAMFRPAGLQDYLPLPLEGLEGPVRISIRNEHQESQYVDAVRMGFVAHGPGTSVVAAANGHLMIVAEGSPPRSVSGPGATLPLFSKEDGTAWQTVNRVADDSQRDELEAEFAAPSSGKYALLLTAEQTHWYELVMRRFIDESPAGNATVAELAPGALQEWHDRQGIDFRVERHASTWRRIGSFPSHGTEGFRRSVLPLGELAEGESIRLRMSAGRGFWRVDSLTLVPIVDPDPSVIYFAPVAARSEQGTDLKRELATADGVLHEMHAVGNSITLIFNRPGSAGTAFLATTGSYRVPRRGRQKSPLDHASAPRSSADINRELAQLYGGLLQGK